MRRHANKTRAATRRLAALAACPGDGSRGSAGFARSRGRLGAHRRLAHLYHPGPRRRRLPERITDSGGGGDPAPTRFQTGRSGRAPVPAANTRRHGVTRSALLSRPHGGQNNYSRAA
jgi:hypothetical protein